MGLWGSVSALFKGSPRREAPTEYQAPGYTGGAQFNKNQQKGNQAYFDSYMNYMKKEPGFAERDLKDMYLQPAEQSRQSERATMRQMNQGASFGGSYRGGGRVRGRGQVMSAYGANRADMQRATRTRQAEAALSDRQFQLGAGQQFSAMTGGQEMGESAMRNNYDMGLNQLSDAAWRTNLGQYNNQYAQGLQHWGASLQQGGSGGGMGGGGGMGMPSGGGGMGG